MVIRVKKRPQKKKKGSAAASDMTGFTDIHSHFIYGVDDGAKTYEDMIDLLDAAYADGIRGLVATPHHTPGIAPFPEELFLQRLNEAHQYCQARGYDITLYAGAEILYTPAMEPYVRQRRLPTYRGTTQALVEFVPDITARELENVLALMEDCGYTTVLAHIERYDCMVNGQAKRLKSRYDVRYQINCSAVLENRGFFRAQRVKRWLREGLIDAVATDMHHAKYRPPRMQAAYRALVNLVGQDEAKRLMTPKLT